jgi:hypothetical protein
MISDRFVENVWELAYTFRMGGEVVPVWFLQTDESMQIITTPFDADNPNSKGDQANKIAEIVTELKSTRVVFVSDVWTRNVGKDTPESEKWIRPSQCSDAVEAIIAQVWDSDKTSYMLMRLYRENDKGELEKIQDIKTIGPSETEVLMPVVKAVWQNG